MYSRGWPELVKLSNPAAGALATRRIPGETFEAVMLARATLTTSAAVANRFPGLDILDGDGTLVFRVTSTTALGVSSMRRTFWAHDLGVGNLSPSSDESLPFTGTLFPPGFQIRYSVNAIDVGDQLSTLSLFVWRIPSGEWDLSHGAIPWSQQ